MILLLGLIGGGAQPFPSFLASRCACASAFARSFCSRSCCAADAAPGKSSASGATVPRTSSNSFIVMSLAKAVILRRLRVASDTSTIVRSVPMEELYRFLCFCCVPISRMLSCKHIQRIQNIRNQDSPMNKTVLTRTLRPRLLLATLVLLCASCTGNWRHLPAVEWRASMALISSSTIGAPLEPVFRMVMGGR